MNFDIYIFNALIFPVEIKYDTFITRLLPRAGLNINLAQLAQWVQCPGPVKPPKACEISGSHGDE
jgi:hypothetical protein